MPGAKIRRYAFAAAMVVATGMLGACVVVPNPNIPGPTPGPGITEPVPPQVQTRTFNDPRVGGRWVDLCYAQGSCRQQQQIDAFCQQQGYDRGISSYSRNTVIFQTNVRLGDQSVCRSTGVGNCHRVASVTCERSG
ncbi:MAG: hypothetical protein KDA49_05415 [Rhodospirillaceae bacterium]|nr:hypothetical protein [Rhodospirillaceae bacterium]MCA8931883.1 hypothetical protein [Rhodospirillaceae bacterium]